jgi:hypothetical protein
MDLIDFWNNTLSATEGVFYLAPFFDYICANNYIHE